MFGRRTKRNTKTPGSYLPRGRRGSVSTQMEKAGVS